VRRRLGKSLSWRYAPVSLLLAAAVWSGGQSLLKGQAAPTDATKIFSPAHSSISEAVLHFFGHRPATLQPIAFVHKVHVDEVELSCKDCHVSAERGVQASIPDIRTCWNCHEMTLTEHAEIKKIKAYHDKGLDIPWQRVWGWNDEAHVRFNHAPHVRQGIECATCHGDVSQMAVATRTMEHTMGFCVGCHREKNASDDCVTCHY